MIPLGNWADRIDELESENHDLREELARQEDEIADLLFEVDHLRAKKTELELDVEGLLALVEHWQEKAAEAADDVSYWIDSSREADEFSYEQQARLDAVEERAGSWFEVAKKLVRSRNVWMRVANRDLELRYQVEQELSELKKALRTLSQ